MRTILLAAFMASVVPFMFIGCTNNGNARLYGGTQTICVTSGHKLVNVTWKDVDFWILSRPMRDGETPETHVFEELSQYGVFQGKIILKEKRRGDTSPCTEE